MIKNTPFYLSRAILFAACFALLAPLIVNYNYYYPYVFLKSILIRVAIQAMLLLYIFLALLAAQYRPRFHRIIWALLAYFGVMLLCSLPGVSSNAWGSWWGDFIRMDGMFAQLHLLAYFFILAQTLREESDWMVLWSASLYSGVLMGLTGLIQREGLNFIFHFDKENPRIDGATGNADFFASFMLLNLCVAIHLLTKKNRRDIYPAIAKAWLALLIAVDASLVLWDAASGGAILFAGLSLFPIILSVLVLHCAVLGWFFLRRRAWAGLIFLSLLVFYYLFWMIQSQTRASIVGLAAGVAFLFFFYVWKRIDSKLKWVGISFILLLAILAFGRLIQKQPKWMQQNPLIARLAEISLKEHRLLSWKSGATEIIDHPVWGWGPEQYRKAFERHAPVELFQESPTTGWDDRAHNIILDVGITTGFMGLAAFLLFYYFVFVFLLGRWFRDPVHADCLSIGALIAANFVQNLFIFDTVNTNGLYFAVLAYIAYLYGKSASNSTPASPPDLALHPISGKGYLILAATAAILGCDYWYVVKKPHDSNLLLNYTIASEKIAKQQSPSTRSLFDESLIGNFQRADADGTVGRYLIREELANYAFELLHTPGIDPREKSHIALEAAALLEKSVREDPLDPRHYLYAASLINEAEPYIRQTDANMVPSLLERNLEWLQRAEALSPNRSRIFSEKGNSLLSLAKVDQAVQEFQKAFSLDPDNRSICLDLTAAYIRAGRFQDADLEWQKARTFSPRKSDYEKMIELYGTKKQYAAVISLSNDCLRVFGNDPLLMARLAVAYRDSGDVLAARQAALQAAQLSSQVAASLQEFLKSLEKHP